MTTHPHPSTHADTFGWRRPLCTAIAILMLLVGPAAVGGFTPTDPGWPASPPTEQPVPPADHPGSNQQAPSSLGCRQPQAAASDPDPVGTCNPAGPAATPSPASAATPAPTTATTTAGPMVL